VVTERAEADASEKDGLWTLAFNAFLAIVLTLFANIVVVVVIVVVNVVVGKHNDGNKQYDMIL